MDMVKKQKMDIQKVPNKLNEFRLKLESEEKMLDSEELRINGLYEELRNWEKRK